MKILSALFKIGQYLSYFLHEGEVSPCASMGCAHTPLPPRDAPFRAENSSKYGTKRWIHTCLISFFAAFSFGCAEEVHSIDPNDGYQHIMLPSDAADCPENLNCGVPFSKADIYQSGTFSKNPYSNPEYYSGYFGYIDNECHENYKVTGIGQYMADMDVVAVYAPKGAALHVFVEKARSNGSMHPIIYLLDKFGNELVYSYNNKNKKRADLWFIAPSEPFYISIEDAANYDKFTNDCSSSVFHGGVNYSYAMTVEDTTRQLVESFGAIQSAKSHTTVFSELSGEAFYYKVKVDTKANSNFKGGVKVSLAAKSPNGKRCPVAMQIDFMDDGYSHWGDGRFSVLDTLRGKCYNTSDLDETLEQTSTELSPSITDSDGYMWFVVTDYNAETNYEYKLTVTPL